MATSPSPTSSPAPPTERTPIRSPGTTTLPDRTAETTSTTSTPFIPSWRRPTIDPNGQGVRSPSVQFVPQIKGNGEGTRPASRASSVHPAPRPSAVGRAAAGTARRMSSPPPPAHFRPSVSFDTFSNKLANNFSLTLNRKHRAYEYTKRSRTFLCGTDMNDYSDTALEWLIEELVDDGDEVVCLRVVEKDSKQAVKWAGGMGEKGYRLEAQRFLEAIEKKNVEDRAICLVLEFAVGKVNDTIQQMIRIYEPALLVVGTRGRSLTGYSGLLSSGSISKYCLQYSPVPVIVVRPSSKREAKKRKRLRDPSRTGYRDILDKSDDAHGGRGGHLLDAHNRSSITGSDLGALGQLGSAHDPENEARMVAEAIGYKGAPIGPRPPSRDKRDSSLSRLTSAQSDNFDVRSLGGDQRVVRSPDLANLDSPALSEDESSEDDDDAPIGRLAESVVRPEDEALALAYERAQKIMEEEKEDAEARALAQKNRAPRGAGSRSRSRMRQDDADEGRGAAALGLLAQLDRGLR